ncbi:hypothetical protein HK105_204103 [Polyrhizophydium stewartii]|uniref:Uncharacterized protein n=1 Tax=Polyrhizophydium stewartii TaxID=2732419 RepID=A0ABR4NA12_9FUNG
MAQPGTGFSSQLHQLLESLTGSGSGTQAILPESQRTPLDEIACSPRLKPSQFAVREKKVKASFDNDGELVDRSDLLAARHQILHVRLRCANKLD